MNAVVEKTSNTAGVAAWVCLAIAWICFLLPIPGLGLFIGWPLNLVAFILAIVAMAKRGVMSGLVQLLASLIGSPVVYFIGLLIFGAAVGGLDQSMGRANDGEVGKSVQTASAEDAQTIDVAAETIFAAYEANEVAADSVYKGKRLRVTGTVGNIDSGAMDEPVVQFDAGGILQHVSARGLDAATAGQLSKGQSLTLQCTGAGEVIGFPMLEDCRLD